MLKKFVLLISQNFLLCALTFAITLAIAQITTADQPRIELGRYQIAGGTASAAIDPSDTHTETVDGTTFVTYIIRFTYDRATADGIKVLHLLYGGNCSINQVVPMASASFDTSGQRIGGVVQFPEETPWQPAPVGSFNRRLLDIACDRV